MGGELRMKAKLVEVTWIDIETHGGWHDDKDDDFTLMKAYGLLVKKTKDRYTLASGYDPSGKQWSDKMYFPIGVVKRVRVIEEVSL